MDQTMENWPTNFLIDCILYFWTHKKRLESDGLKVQQGIREWKTRLCWIVLSFDFASLYKRIFIFTDSWLACIYRVYATEVESTLNRFFISYDWFRGSKSTKEIKMNKVRVWNILCLNVYKQATKYD